MMDEPPAVAWFRQPTAIGWTRDPFDRLIAAHAQARKWRLATGDIRLLEHLDPGASIRL
jgi:PIN domain nuclease of toxin-antitoxin system